MRLFGFQVSRDTGQREIEAPRPIQRQTEPSVLERLNQLETTVERLELDNTERQLAVLNVVEKIQHQLRARESKRAREAPNEVPDDGLGDSPGVLARSHIAGGGVPLVNRFRGF